MCTRITIFIVPHNEYITLLEVCEGCNKQTVVEIIAVKMMFL